MAATPMFPLGSVLVPGMALPLHVFEPRFRALTEHCLDTGEPFGVALIERGFEVGGGDQRFATACLASIIESHRYDDGRFGILAAGTDRVRITAWLDDAPYPCAEVESWPDADEAPPDDDTVTAVRSAARRMFALAAEAGIDAPPATMDLADDVVALGWQLTAGAPFQPLDRLRLLEAPGPTSRLELAGRMVDDSAEILSSLLSEAPGGDLPD